MSATFAKAEYGMPLREAIAVYVKFTTLFDLGCPDVDVSAEQFLQAQAVLAEQYVREGDMRKPFLEGFLKEKPEKEYQNHLTVVYGDETYCKRCEKRWDTNDPDEPNCLEKQ